LTFLLGLVASVLWVRASDNDWADKRQGIAQASAGSITEEASARLGSAITAAQRFSLITVASWPTQAEFDSGFDEISAQLPGDSSALVVVRISPERRDGFAQAERLSNPTFVLSQSGDGAVEEMVVMRSITGDPSVGTTLASSTHLADHLLSLPATGVHLFPAELGATDPAGEMQLIIRSKAEGPDGERYDSWTIIQIDLVEAFDGVHLVAGSNAGVRLAIDSIGPIGTFGPDQGGADSIFDSVPVGPIELDVEVWSQDMLGAQMPTVVRLAMGIFVAGGITLIAYLILALAENRRRATVEGEQARRDHLTGIPNRRWVVEYLADHGGESIAVLFCDLDRFKVVNDSAGHGAGDNVLLQVVTRLQSVLDDCCKIARFGGDEFLVICSDSPEMVAHAQSTANRINAAMADPFPFGSSEFTTTMSIGIAVGDNSTAASGEELIRAGDVALGLCKQRGRNGAVLYDDTLREAELDRLAFERDLRASLDCGDLTLHYQPIVASDERIVSYEALVRWQRNGQLVNPSDFLPVLEEIGRMSDLGEIVLRKAVAEFGAGVDPASSTTLHVNIAADQLVDPNFPSLVEEVLADHCLAPGRLILELTEGGWAQSMQRITPVLDELSRLGVRLSIDDFGAGYSNIGRALTVNGLAEIKLDRSLIRDMFQVRNHEFVAGFTETMMRLGLSVIAEGIETVEDFHCVRRAGVPQFQGFLFARPKPACEIDFAAVRSPGGRIALNPPQRQPTNASFDQHELEVGEPLGGP